MVIACLFAAAILASFFFFSSSFLVFLARHWGVVTSSLWLPCTGIADSGSLVLLTCSGSGALVAPSLSENNFSRLVLESVKHREL